MEGAIDMSSICEQLRGVRQLVTRTAHALALLAATGPAMAEPILEWQQHTSAQFLADATWRGGPHSAVQASQTTIAWSDHDSTSRITLVDAGSSLDAPAGPSVVVGRARIADPHGETSAVHGDSLVLRHENSVIGLDHATLASVTLAVRGTLHAMAGPRPGPGMPFDFVTEIVFLESDNHGACAFEMGELCPDLLFTLEEELLAERIVELDGERYLHSPLVVHDETGVRRYPAEQCDRVRGWNGRGACVGLVTAENSTAELALGFRVTVLAEPVGGSLALTALLAGGFVGRRRLDRRRSQGH